MKCRKVGAVNQQFVREILLGLQLFRFSPEETSFFGSSFKSVLTDLDLSGRDHLKDFLLRYNGSAGIYFWVLRHESVQYKIYIGKTTSLSRRVLNYTTKFQPHSPNDSKLQIFQAFISELLPAAALDLYFAEQDLANLTQAETDANRRYQPLFYKLPTPSVEAKEELRKAFHLYYRAAFETRCR